MSTALTFGSVGDIIALCGLAVELSRALSSTRGSSHEYQFMCKDLDQFVQVLMQVIATYHQFQASPWLDGLASITKSFVDESGKLLREVSDCVRDKYKDSLQARGSGNMVKDMFRKLEFSVREREKMVALRNDLANAVGRLGLLSSCAAIHSQRVDNATLISRIEQLERHIATHDDVEDVAQATSRLTLQAQRDDQQRHAENEQHSQQLTRVENLLISQLSKTSEQLNRMEYHRTEESSHISRQLARIQGELIQQSSSRTILIAGMTGTFSVISDIKEIVMGIVQALASLQVAASSHWFLQGPTELTIVFEDPFGRVDPFPLNWIHNWEGPHTIIELRFQNSRGYEMVVRKEYVLEDDCNGRIIDQERPFREAFVV